MVGVPGRVRGLHHVRHPFQRDERGAADIRSTARLAHPLATCNLTMKKFRPGKKICMYIFFVLYFHVFHDKALVTTQNFCF